MTHLAITGYFGYVLQLAERMRLERIKCGFESHHTHRSKTWQRLKIGFRLPAVHARNEWAVGIGTSYPLANNEYLTDSAGKGPYLGDHASPRSPSRGQ